MRRMALLGVLLALVALAFVGCSKDDGDSVTDPGNEKTKEARFQVQIVGADNDGDLWGLPGIVIDVDNDAETPFKIVTGDDGVTQIEKALFLKTSFAFNSIGKQTLTIPLVTINKQCVNPGGGVGGILCFDGYQGELELEVRENGGSGLEYFWAKHKLDRQ